jgi:hypothetical protein
MMDNSYHNFKLSKICIHLNKDENKFFPLDFFWMAIFDHPLFIHSNFFGQFFFHMTHMHAFYQPPKLYGKWSTTS